MSNYKFALIALNRAGMNLSDASNLQNRLNSKFGTWTINDSGILSRGALVLTYQDLRTFLHGASSVSATVGIMEATISAGKDGVIGTSDDTVSIKPLSPKKEAYDYWEEDGIWHCNYCKVTRKTEKGILSHLLKEHGIK